MASYSRKDHTLTHGLVILDADAESDPLDPARTPWLSNFSLPKEHSRAWDFLKQNSEGPWRASQGRRGGHDEPS